MGSSLGSFLGSPGDSTVKTAGNVPKMAEDQDFRYRHYGEDGIMHGELPYHHPVSLNKKEWDWAG